MSGLPPLSSILRCLVFGLLMVMAVIRPALAFAEEAREIAAIDAAQTELSLGEHGHDHPPGQPGTADDGDNRWHLSHCCGPQAAMLPRYELRMLALETREPVPPRAFAFVPAPLPAPFRPPIAG
ncbi:hypothetical protein [Lysobacter sp. cf310]|uniref:hypothetical protein n=1 Tax=Lysobacter sp. cf310 TaxID=1761790 RepID=UPI0008EBE82C|nr:hypothetical protein [Lysobacter sp. cf310]SFK51791.1 hypothetical protein SAMN04487938_1189 [Lysobacter sp. cf310]